MSAPKKKCHPTKVVVRYDTICCCRCCECPEHRSRKIMSELHFGGETPKSLDGYIHKRILIDRLSGRGPMTPAAIKSRARQFADILGVPLEDLAPEEGK